MPLKPWMNWLGLAKRAGKLAPGDHQVRAALAGGRVKLVVIAEDAGPAVYRRYHLWLQDLGIPLIRQGTKTELGHAIGVGPHAVLAILDANMAKAIVDRVGDIAGGMTFGGKRQSESIRTGQGTEARQPQADRSAASATRRRDQESHEHGRTRSRSDRAQHHGRQTASGGQSSPPAADGKARRGSRSPADRTDLHAGGQSSGSTADRRRAGTDRTRQSSRRRS